jgi:hypothetical protein
VTSAPPPLFLRWTPTPADLQESVEVARWARGGAARHKNSIVAGILAAVGAVEIALGFWWLAVPALLLVPVVLLAYAPLNRWALWRAMPLARQPVEVVVAPAELRWTSHGTGSYTSSWQWSSFWSALETERLFVVLGRPGARKSETLTSYLPKRALGGPAGEAHLRALLVAVLPGGVRPR